MPTGSIAGSPSIVSPLRDENGKIIKWYGTAFDIDDRKRAEEAVLRAAKPILRKHSADPYAAPWALQWKTISMFARILPHLGFDLAQGVRAAKLL